MSGDTVPGHLVGTTLISHVPVLQRPYDREQYGCSARPDLFIPLPEVFIAIDFQAAEFSTHGIDGRFQVFVVYREHSEKVSGM